MAPSHRYDLIKESDDIKDEAENDPKDEPRNINIPTTTTPWWKYLFYLLLAFSAGLGASLGVVLAPSIHKSSDSAAASATPSTSLSAELTPTSSSDLLLPTTALEHAEDKVSDPANLRGQILECGHSPEEARSRGCVYDVMMQDWVPEPCFDPVLTERYLATGNYTWYADPDGNTMSDEEMRKGEHSAAWMAQRYHKAHCIFSWEKLIRALRNNEPISQELLSYDHVLHCRHQTLGGDMEKRDGIGVYAPTNYAKCALYNTWRNEFLPDKHSSNEK